MQELGVLLGVGSRDGEGGQSKVPLTRLSVAVATIATLVVVALVRWFGLGCGCMTGSRSGTTGIVDGGTCVARAVTINIPGLSAVEAKVIAASTIAFREGDVTIRRELHGGVARGGRSVGSLIIVVTAVVAFSRVVIPTVPWLGVIFRRSRKASL